MKLDKTQEEIVNSNESKIIVNAGAGSGKTRVLIERIVRLLNEGVDPTGIVAITFTNMAANEMKTRIAEYTDTTGMFIGTIHSFANTILKASEEEYMLFTDDTENYYMSDLIKKYAKYLDYKKYILFKSTKQKEKLGIRVKVKSFDILDHDEYKEYEQFMKLKPNESYPQTISSLKKKYNAISFDELIEKASQYFKEINGKVDYLFVDEFQDICPMEYEFFKALNASNYFLVGDDWQSLYSFKGSCVDIFLSLFDDDSWAHYIMANNYRSGEKIIDAANYVVRQAQDIMDKDVEWKNRFEGEVIHETKRNFIRVIDSIDSSKYGDYAVLVRTNRELEEVKNSLVNNCFPCMSFKKSDLTLEELQKLMTENKIKVLTVHTSKGLEFKNVILYGNWTMNEPQYRKNSEERKVMYVGMTRAIKKLIIMN